MGANVYVSSRAHSSHDRSDYIITLRVGIMCCTTHALLRSIIAYCDRNMTRKERTRYHSCWLCGILRWCVWYTRKSRVTHPFTWIVGTPGTHLKLSKVFVPSGMRFCGYKLYLRIFVPPVYNFGLWPLGVKYLGNLYREYKQPLGADRDFIHTNLISTDNNTYNHVGTYCGVYLQVHNI